MFKTALAGAALLAMVFATGLAADPLTSGEGSDVAPGSAPVFSLSASQSLIGSGSRRDPAVIAAKCIPCTVMTQCGAAFGCKKKNKCKIKSEPDCKY